MPHYAISPGHFANLLELAEDLKSLRRILLDDNRAKIKPSQINDYFAATMDEFATRLERIITSAKPLDSTPPQETP